MRVRPVSLAASLSNQSPKPAYPHFALPFSPQNSNAIKYSHSNRHKRTSHFQPNTSIQTTPVTHKQLNQPSQTHPKSTIYSHSMSHNSTRNSRNSALQYCVFGINYQAHFSNPFHREMLQVNPEHCIYSANLKLKLANSTVIQ